MLTGGDILSITQSSGNFNHTACGASPPRCILSLLYLYPDEPIFPLRSGEDSPPREGEQNEP
jgi:hypothetical protein